MKKLLLLTAIIPFPLIAWFVWFFSINKKKELNGFAKELINFQFNFLFYLFCGFVLLPLIISVAVILVVIFYYFFKILKGLLSSDKTKFPVQVNFL